MDMRKDNRNYGQKKDHSSGAPSRGKGKFEGKKDHPKDGSFGKSRFSKESSDKWPEKKSGFGKSEFSKFAKGEGKPEKKFFKPDGPEGKKRNWDDNKDFGKPRFGKDSREEGKGRYKDERPSKFRSDSKPGRDSREEGRNRYSDEKPARFRAEGKPGRDSGDKGRNRFDEERPSKYRSDSKPGRDAREEGRGRYSEEKAHKFGPDSKPGRKPRNSEQENDRRPSFEEKRIKRFFKEDEDLQKGNLAKPNFSKFDKNKTPSKPDFERSPEETGPDSDTGHEETKAIYLGRGKDEKPVFGRITKSEESKRLKSSRDASKAYVAEATHAKPKYDLEKIKKGNPDSGESDQIRLNKYISNSGICSRREADTLIQNGDVQVNGQVITEMGYKVLITDKVTYKGNLINPEKPVYILLNKPKDFITTTDDPMERKTVMHLIANACEERVFPVGRLDRNTTGLLLFTNDGELADKLTHPSNEVKKIYQITLDRPLTQNDEKAILEGITLEDGPVSVDDMQVLSLDRKILGMEIHLGRNRIVRRIFAHFGYEVEALDRVVFAGLDKKDIPRGKYRFLSEQEVIRLKYFK